MKLLVSNEIDKYVSEKTKSDSSLLKEVSEITKNDVLYPQMLTGPVAGQFLKMLVLIQQPRLIVEVGTFTGYSALSMAEGLPENGRIITCDIDPVATKVAQEAFDKSKFTHQITLVMGPALETIGRIDEPIDMAFIDADKANYPAYYETLIEKTRSGGLIVIDNALWSGDVIDPKDDDSKAIDQLNTIIAHDERVENVLLTVRDGIHLVRKR